MTKERIILVDISVEVPTYNEAENIPVLIDKLEKLKLDLEIIIIETGVSPNAIIIPTLEANGNTDKGK